MWKVLHEDKEENNCPRDRQSRIASVVGVDNEHDEEKEAVNVLLEDAAEPNEHNYDVFEQNLEEMKHFEFFFDGQVWFERFY